MVRRFLPLVLALATLATATQAAADTSPDPPVADPIAGPITMSGLEIRLEHVVTIPPTGASPLTRINGATHAGDGSGRLFVPDLRGEVFVVDGGSASVYLDVAATHADFADSPGLGSGLSWIAFHPDFAVNGRFVTAHTETGAALTTHTPDFAHQLGETIHGVVTEWTATAPAASPFAGTSRELLRIGFGHHFHGIQQLEFGPDGYLFIGVGDGDNTVFSTGPQSLDRAHGKLLRIDVDGSDSANGAYGIPPTNPHVGVAGAVEEIYARGFRNPHRFTWDEPSGKLLLANIGQGNIESVYEVIAGAHHGWNEREGAFLWDPATPDEVYPLPAGDAAFGYTYPVATYDHDEGFAIVGGHVHRHPGVPELYGEYVFGDISNGRIFHASEADMTNGLPPAAIGEIRLFDESDDEVTLLGLSPASRVDLRFGLEEDGHLVITSKQTGDVYRLTDRTPTPLPTITPGAVTVAEAPGGTLASIPFTLSAPTPLPVSMAVTTLPGSSAPGLADATDFEATAGTVSFAPMTTTATFTVTVNDDAVDEDPELLGVVASSPVNGVLSGLGLGLVEITDDDPTPTVSPGGFVANPEGDAGTVTWTLPVTLAAPSGRTVTVDWSTVGIPANPLVAVPGTDVVAATGTVAFAPGETVVLIPIDVIGDTVDEPPLLYGEWGLVALTDPVNTTVTGGLFGHGLYIIIDDD